MRDIRCIIDSCYAPVGDVDAKGVLCRTSNQKQALLHVKLTSLAADIPDREDLLGLKRGSRAPPPCYLCTAKQGTFYFATNVELRSLSAT